MAKSSKKKSDFTKIQHVGVVVKDIKKAIEFLESLGIGPFTAPGVKPGKPPVFTIPFKGELHGKPAAWKTAISFAKIGDVELELLEPAEGEQALKESLDKTGEGLHHIGFFTDDLDAEIANLKKNGVAIWTIAREAGGGGFLYSCPTPIGGIAIEFRKIGRPPKR